MITSDRLVFPCSAAAALIVGLLAVASAEAQTITTYAGGGPLGDGKNGTEATLAFPRELAFGPDGDLYLSDTYNNVVRRIDSQTGIISTAAGGGSDGPIDDVPAMETQFLNPRGVAVDSSGNLYVADRQHRRICRVDGGTGIATTIAGGSDAAWPGEDGDPAVEVLVHPSGLAIGPDGDLYWVERQGNQVRKVELDTGVMRVVVGDGTPGEGGDGGPATAAQLNLPWNLAFDERGDLFISGPAWNHVRRVRAETGIIDSIPLQDTWRVIGLTARGGALYLSANVSQIVKVDLATTEETIFAGTGERSFYGDGSPAGNAALSNNGGLVFDAEGNLFVADTDNNRIRRIAGTTNIIETVAGGGPVGDGGPATSAVLSVPWAVRLTPAGELLIGGYNDYRLRLVDPVSRIIRTVAGDGIAGTSGDGGPAADARLAAVEALAVDAAGNIFVGGSRSVRKIDSSTGVITLYAGNGGDGLGGDGGPATEALLGSPAGLAIDPRGNLYVSSYPNHVIRRVDAETGIIDRFAGTGDPGFSGDGGAAIDAQLRFPTGLAFHGDSSLYVAEWRNGRVRRIDTSTGIITTVAGNGSEEWSGDGGLATDAGIQAPIDVGLDELGNLYIAELDARTNARISRIRRVDSQTGIITTIAGTGMPGGFRGDGGPAGDANLSDTQFLAVSPDGDIFEAEAFSNRVRAIFACSAVDPPALIQPADSAADLGAAPTLEWGSSRRAFFYDVVLDRNPAPSTIVATDLTTTSFTPSNLEPGATYYWKVIANGDPFCEEVRSAESEVRSFSTAAACDPPGVPTLLGPAEGFTSTDTTIALTWETLPGAGRYDVHLGTTNPPPLVRSTGSTSLAASGLVPGNTYYWMVIAHAACDETQVSTSEVRSFEVVGSCEAAGPFSLVEPSAGAVGVATSTTLRWTASANASDYDLYLGTTNPPAIFLPEMTGTAVRISGLLSDETYYWRVVANVDCDETKNVATDVVSFTTIDDCRMPEGTSVTFTPPGDVGVGQTYVITWREARGLDAGGNYLVERSREASFATILDSQAVSTTSATFLATSTGMHYHRIRPVMGCNPAVKGPVTGTATVRVVEEKPNIIFTVEPEAVVATPGRALEDVRSTFTIENISSSPRQVVIAQALIDSVPFFTVRDPLGGDAVFVTLQPREPKTFEIRFSGPPNDREEAYQGLIALSVANSPVIPYAFVNLKVGDRGTAKPEFLVGGLPSEYAFFPGFDGDDSTRPSIKVEIRNPGATPMELGAEIGPEVWLEPDPTWNETPIPAGGTREVELYTRRTRALNGSALPRYTWFGVRTKTGEAARMLVQDNDSAAVGAGRTSALEPDEKALVIPEVVSESSASGAALVSQLRLTNLGSDEVQAELVFTPTGVDGFSSGVRRATVVVPPNDVAMLTDPLVQVFGLGRPASGQIEIRAADAKIGLLRAESGIVAGDRADASLSRIPTVRRGDGARAGQAHEIVGVTRSATEQTLLVLAETGGTDQASVRLRLYDGEGSLRTERTVTVGRYGHVRIDDMVSGTVAAGRLAIDVTDGGGSVVAMAKILNTVDDYVAVLMSEPVTDGVNAKHSRHRLGHRSPMNGATVSLAAPYVARGSIVEGSAGEYTTLMGFAAPFLVPVSFVVRFTSEAGDTIEKTVMVPGGAIVEHRDVLKDLFALAGTVRGSIVVEADPRGRVYARLMADGTSAGPLDLASPVSELVTTIDSARPLVVDGLEQSTEAERGTKWNLYVREIAGESGVVSVRLYEAGNRTLPIAVRQFAIGGGDQLRLETVFDAMGLNSETRRKNRANVLCMVTPEAGGAVVTAVVIEIDNRTGAVTSHTLQPASGLSGSAGAPTLARVVEPGSEERRRPVRR